VAAAQKAAGGKDDWGGKGNKGNKSLKTLRRSIMALMADCGEPITPRAGEPVVQALKLRYVRAEFIKSWPADGDDEKDRRDAKSLAFRRALADAVDRGVIETRELNGEDYVWLAGAAAEAAPAAGKINGGGDDPFGPTPTPTPTPKPKPAEGEHEELQSEGSLGQAFILNWQKAKLKERGFTPNMMLNLHPDDVRKILDDPTCTPEKWFGKT
jgi:hypothetical protein